MTEKQFKINTEEIGYIYIDNNDKHMSWREVVDLLNEQDMLIKSQTKQLQKQHRIIEEQDKRITELEAENQRMKIAFKRKYDYDIEEVVAEVCDGDVE